MKKRFLMDIKLKGDHVIEFFHDDTYLLNSFSTNDIEAISFWNEIIYFYPCNKITVPHIFRATEDDFTELKKIVSKSPDFVCCGDSYIFALDNVVAFSKGRKDDYLIIDCRYNNYSIKTESKEDMKDFIMAMKRKWQKAFTELDQSRDSEEMEEDTLSR